MRIQLRDFSRRNQQSATEGLFVHLSCEYLNVFTGQSGQADEIFQQTLYSQTRQRFGEIAILPSEKFILQRVEIVFVIVYFE